MMSKTTNEALEVHIQYIKTAVDEMKGGVKQINEKINKDSKSMAVMKYAITGILTWLMVLTTTVLAMKYGG